MHWIVTHDLLGDDPGVIGHGWLPWGNQGPPRDGQHKTADRRTLWVEHYLRMHGAEFTHEFRLLDGDNEPYYQGRCGDCTSTDADSAFAPEDWAAGHAGCTTMEYRKVGETEWEVL